MKICLLGIFSGYLDEGYRNIAFNLSKELSRKNDVLNMDVRKICSINFWKRIREFRPNTIHYLTAPTLSSFIILRIAKRFSNKDAKLVISSLNPYSLKLLRNIALRRFISLVKPDLVLTQCVEVEAILRGIGCDTEFLPNGVDTERFTPVSREIKEKLREKYGINKEEFLILHVGHIRRTRGLKIFCRIQKESGIGQVIIVSSSYFKREEKPYQQLIKSGCIVWNKYFEKISEIYGLADCYVFPVKKGKSIFMPLSIMEAMSCNLPVISTKFEGITRAFEEGDGLIFAEREEDFYMALEKIRNGDIEVKTRKKVLSYSLENVGKKLNRIYDTLLSSK